MKQAECLAIHFIFSAKDSFFNDSLFFIQQELLCMTFIRSA